MLNHWIAFSLHHRMLVLATAFVLLIFGTWQAFYLPIDVFPDLNRPRVVIMTEAPGLAPEEVESLITFPLETTLNGATGVQAVRSMSGVGLSVIYVEFDWETDIYDDRQIVNERLALVRHQLPAGANPQLAPISSVMGQIQIIGLISQNGETPPMELRTIADWVVRQRLLTVPGVSQVITMGGDRKQFQVLVNPTELARYGVTLGAVKEALRQSNQNSAGGYLDQQGPNELLVRSLGRISSLAELEGIVIDHHDGQSIRLAQVATIVEGPQTRRGDSSAYDRAGAAEFRGGPAVVLTIHKQPNADTRRVTLDTRKELDELQASLPKDVIILDDLYQQQSFIDLAIRNVVEALRDGTVLVVIILWLFLMNFRATFITLLAIPLSLAITSLVFRLLDLSINTMTLGGIAVAIGELVDDAVVDVENIVRRLRENAATTTPLPPLLVVFRASSEIRSSIVFGTMIVVLVFIPLFALHGMEGRLFVPLGIAYIVSIIASLIVSLTVTPVLSSLLLPQQRRLKDRSDGPLLRYLKHVAARVIQSSVRWSRAILVVSLIVVLVAAAAFARLERDFLPPFDEGAVQINVLMPAGTSLAKSTEVARQVEERLKHLPDITSLVRRTGRAELDEHTEGVNVSEFIATLAPHKGRSRTDVIDDISASLQDVPGIITSVEQPLAHLISHMISGIKAQVAIKIYGDDLDKLRQYANQARTTVSKVAGVRDLQVEQQVNIPQLRIEADGSKLERFGLRRSSINDFVQTAMQGEVVSQVVDGQRTFDLVVRLDESYRENLEMLRRLAIELPDGGAVKLEDVANIYPSSGPNTINREHVRRRATVMCNISGRGLVDVVNEMRASLAPMQQQLPPGYYVEFGGQFESQQSASQRIVALFAFAVIGMFLVLYTLFGSANLALQVMVALPAAFIGAVAALYVTGQTVTVASMVGFISLCGIAARNGILLINHYLHLVKHEGEQWSVAMLVRAGQDRLAPVVMTALTSGIGLVPLAMSAGEPGKEILYPIATVILGGMITSTGLEFLLRPALFWRFGLKSAAKIVDTDRTRLKLVDAD